MMQIRLSFNNRMKSVPVLLPQSNKVNTADWSLLRVSCCIEDIFAKNLYIF